jgi:hypothetical protein
MDDQVYIGTTPQQYFVLLFMVVSTLDILLEAEKVCRPEIFWFCDVADTLTSHGSRIAVAGMLASRFELSKIQKRGIRASS